MNDGYVKVKSIKESSKKLSAQFVTMEGHMEKGMINFNLSKTEDGIKFSIDSKSEVDYGMVPEDFARSKQKESWKQVLDNVVEKTGGEEAERNVEISDPDSNWDDSSSDMSERGETDEKSIAPEPKY